MGLGLHDLKNYWRFRRVVENPWQAARARRGGEVGEPLVLRLRRGGQVQLRRRTSDIRVFRDVFVSDVYGLADLERSGERLDTVIDIGGHAGLFTIRVSPLARRVITCEPVSANRNLLERNLGTTGRDNVCVVPCAVAGKAGRVRIFLSGNPGGHSMVSAGGETGEVEDVEGVTLDDLFAAHDVERCDLLKLDCEGAEYGILFGASPETLARVRRVTLEYHDERETDPGWTGTALAAHLERSGFRVTDEPSDRHPNVGLMHAQR